MVDKTFIAYFKLVHGFFNLSLFSLFCRQGWLGLRIRRARLAGKAAPLDAVRRHRRAGPVLALWGALGFAAGIVMILLDGKSILEYPLHLAAGAAIVCVIGGLYVASQRITAAAAPVRDVHFRLGMALLALYVLQSFLGLAILL